MKNVRTIISNRCEKLDGKWRKLSARKQKKWVILFFTGYLLLTVGVVITVWYDAKTNTVKQKSVTGHIRNPVVEPKESGSDIKNSSTHIKNNDHDRQ
ncbi:nitrogen regulatory IIA protein [Chryseobacterium sp. MEBOG07]|uniref:nitrogen regulatory IIA protein n=1 Tax=Chryseobacterium sp. MEBOG07 TaxID=2879939 RepID=UPI001F4681BC|nr:nitrogen regulatory IIA protein [Chryseobacterium sp. MEBOG07]UKB78601.1 nitrogen regulatory IIA protein [Chryseobacterium sp. MEBOG07]